MNHRTCRTLTLTERSAAICRLSPDDVEFLLAAHRAHIEVVPTRRRHRYRLTPAGYVGTIITPRCRLVLRPKIPVQNLYYLLDPADPVPVFNDATAPVTGSEILDVLGGRLAHLMAERAVAGLHRGYSERATHSPFIHGRVDVAAQMRDAGRLKDRVHCRHDEFTADVPCNQVPRATAELVLRSPLLGEGVRAALERSLAPYVGVSCFALDAESLWAAAPDRLTDAYRPLLDLCRMLAEGLWPGDKAGTLISPAFLLNMERVFERYLTEGLVRACPQGGQHCVSVQRTYRVNEPVPCQPDLEMRPDITLERNGRPVLVVDAKWKRLPDMAPVTDDIYQVLAYATALPVGRAVLIYPGRRNRVWRYRLARAPVGVEVRTLRVRGTREACSRSLERMAAALFRIG